MSIIKRIILTLVAAGLVFGFIACEKGPMEKAGKKADQGVEDVQKTVKKKQNSLELFLTQVMKTLYSCLFFRYSFSLYPVFFSNYTDS